MPLPTTVAGFLQKGSRMYAKRFKKEAIAASQNVPSVLGWLAVYSHPLTFEDSGIKGYPDIRGKRVFTGPPAGDPAHAAIATSGLFGTVSGGSVTNVVATGVITIPMIKKRGFTSAFAGGVEATASSAGQITPPIMGAAALVMSDLTGISYLTIIVAAIIPALAYYISLFTAVVFEARRLGVEATPDPSMAEEMKVAVQDYRNLLLVFLPICVVVIALLQGFSASGAGMFALYTLIPLSFLNPEIRKKPVLLLLALAKGGRTFSELMMAIGVVGIIIAILGATGLPNDLAQVLNELAGSNLVFVLLIAAAAALMLGMGMPTVPAYLSIILIMGPALQNFGLSVLVSHLFVLYYGVASSIVPPHPSPNRRPSQPRFMPCASGW